MIRLTEEMSQAFAEARSAALIVRPRDLIGARDAGLRAVLAIVDQDRADTPTLVKQAYERGQRDERELTRLLGPPDMPQAAPHECLCLACKLRRQRSECTHVFVDGVGNETDTCQRCGVPE